MSVLVIAEAGVNHNGSLLLAKAMVDSAKAAGVDCIKFQTYKAANLVTKTAQKAQYQQEKVDTQESQYCMLKKLELADDEFILLYKYCLQKNIIFLSTAFDLVSLDFLNELDMKFWKIPSGEITNLPYLIKIAQTNKPILMSTGMSTLEEISEAMAVLHNNGCGEITLLHCTTEYPAPYSEVNLRAMETLRERFGVSVGYSDHTSGIEIAIAAVAMGATVIEKHFTLDRNMEGPDHKASLEPAELRAMVNSIRNVESAMGNGDKNPSFSELKNIPIARKSIIASKSIKKGELFTTNNITTKRPGTGISPMKWFDVLGKIATKNFEEDDLIEI